VPLSALALLLVAAVLHAGWNLLVKSAAEKQIFIWLAWVVGSVCYTPLLALTPALPRAAWPYVLAAGLAQAAYTLALSRAYRIGDFSLVYPLARGAAPALLALWAALFLGERPSPAGLLGLALLLLGLLVVGGAFGRRPAGPARPSRSAVIAALGVALCISVYSAIDGAAVQIAAPITYTVFEFIASALLMAPLMLRRYRPGAIAREWRANWPRIALVGLLMMLAYGLVLLAYSRGHVSYAGAIREVSVVFAALIGWRWLGEGFGRARLAGALLIFAGILAIALAG
jgi:drug/metabolite transporter (DMT)-like permease